MKFSVLLFFILSFALLGLGCASREGKEGSAAKSGYVPLSEAEAKIYTTPTVYYVPHYDLTQQACDPSTRKELKDKNNTTLFAVCPQIYNVCLLQGTCSFKNEQGDFLVNVAGREGAEQRFSRIENKACPYGYGAKRSICLDPYHSVAADLSIYALGTVIYVPTVAGLTLPDGTKHDGYFVVRDSGGAIKGYGRFDFFTGFMGPFKAQNPFLKLGFTDKNTHVQYYVLTESEAAEILKKRNYPSLPVDN